VKFFVKRRGALINPKQIASVAHEANRALTAIIGDVPVQPPWHEAPDDMVQSSIHGVLWRMENRDAPASAQHAEWMKQKLLDGWKWGEKRDAINKTHPALVAYEALPEAVRLKDKLFTAVVLALAD